MRRTSAPPSGFQAHVRLLCCNDDNDGHSLTGAMIARSRRTQDGAFNSHTLEAYSWDPLGLIKRYERRSETVTSPATEFCAADATSSPADIWTYRFSPWQECEQKRHVYLWPAERMVYGAGGVRLIHDVAGGLQYVVTDHLASTRAMFNQAGQVLSTTDYRPLGSPLTSAGITSRTTYIDRETDAETSLGSYGVRLYDAELGRFTSVDLLWGLYEGLQPYQYAGNSPVMALDRNGDSIIVLQDWEGASGMGHSAVLIGGDDVGWKLYSKNGGEYVVFGKSVNPQAGEDKASFKTLAEFQESAGTKETQGRYDNALLIPTSAEEDKKARAAAEKQVKSNYLVVGASCITVVHDALEAAGKLPVVGRTSNDSPIRGLSVIPNVAFKQIDAMVESKNVDSRVISPLRKDPERKEEKE